MTPEPTVPHATRAKDVADLIERAAPKLHLYADEKTAIAELLTREFERVFNDGLLRGRHARTEDDEDERRL